MWVCHKQRLPFENRSPKNSSVPREPRGPRQKCPGGWRGFPAPFPRAKTAAERNRYEELRGPEDIRVWLLRLTGLRFPAPLVFQRSDKFELPKGSSNRHACLFPERFPYEGDRRPTLHPSD